MLLHYFFKSALHCSKCYKQGCQKIWKCLRRKIKSKMHKDQNLYRNCILLSKLFWPAVRKIEIRGWRPRICKNFEITRTICSNSERSEQFLVTKCFSNYFPSFLNPNKLFRKFMVLKMMVSSLCKPKNWRKTKMIIYNRFRVIA